MWIWIKFQVETKHIFWWNTYFPGGPHRAHKNAIHKTKGRGSEIQNVLNRH